MDITTVHSLSTPSPLCPALRAHVQTVNCTLRKGRQTHIQLLTMGIMTLDSTVVSVMVLRIVTNEWFCGSHISPHSFLCPPAKFQLALLACLCMRIFFYHNSTLCHLHRRLGMPGSHHPLGATLNR